MSVRPSLIILSVTIALLGFSACKTVYSDTFSYRKNSFKAPEAKKTEITPPADMANPLRGIAPPGGPDAGLPGAPMPDGAIPGLPGAPDPGMAPPADPGAAPGATPPPPAIPGL